MNSERIITLQVRFDQLAKNHPEEKALEFWFARDLQEPLRLRPLGEFHDRHSEGYRVLQHNGWLVRHFIEFFQPPEALL